MEELPRAWEDASQHGCSIFLLPHTAERVETSEQSDGFINRIDELLPWNRT